MYLARRLVAMAAGVAIAATGTASASAGSVLNQDLATVRAATAKYHDVSVAIADGYTPADVCVASPEGAMGYHYINFDLFGAPRDVRMPAILLYQPVADGGRQLVGVEYAAIDQDQDLTTDDDRPYLFGRGFDGPMEGHEPGMPVHYDLHVWVWQHNPAGMFAQFNPAGSC